MVCFFALFGMVLVLLRQAKAEGSLTRQQRSSNRTSSQGKPGEHGSDTHALFGVSQTGLDLALSNLVPRKQPDWRFMVREGSRGSLLDPPEDQVGSRGRKGRTPFQSALDRPDRAYANKDLGDLTDPQSSQFNIARRA